MIAHTAGRRPMPAMGGIDIKLDGVAKTALETAHNRLLVGGAIFAVCFAVVGLRLVNLGLTHQDEIAQTARAREITAPAPPTRADIVDRNGVLLATNLTTASLFAETHKLADRAATARALAQVLPDISEAELVSTLSAPKGFRWIKRKLTPRQQYEINRLGLPGLDFQEEEQRVYPHGGLAAHAVGFAGIDNEGLAGIEKSLDATLNERTRPLRMSIDIRVQQILRGELAAQITRFDAVGGSGIVMDANNGEVIAMTSLPDFDPNDRESPTEDALFNRNTLGVYELGSVFKIFNHALALDSGVATLNSGYDASKPIRVGRFTINDFHGEDRWLTLPEIFKFSSNIGSAKMALDVGGEAQQRFLAKLGLTRRARIELPEQGRPIVPETWREVNTMTIAYGHGIAVSPLQLVTAVAATVNGGVMHTPTLLRRVPGDLVVGEQVMSAETSDSIRRLMRLVVEDGTGRNGDAPGYLVGGKTGTAEKQVGGRYKRKALISSFVAAFPINAPRYVVMALLDEPKGIKESYGYATGGWTAAPVVSRVIMRSAPLLGVRPVDETDPAIQRLVGLHDGARDKAIAAN